MGLSADRAAPDVHTLLTLGDRGWSTLTPCIQLLLPLLLLLAFVIVTLLTVVVAVVVVVVGGGGRQGCSR